MKTDAERLTDTLNYLQNTVLPPQFTEIQSLLRAAPNQAAISQALSIGHSNPLNTAGRRAKRVLMLLALLLINDPGLRTAEVARIKNLPEGSDRPLIDEIKSWFNIPGINAAYVANHAKTNIGKMPKWNNVNFEPEDAVRGVYKIDRPFNCYNACVFWAFQAGAISKRFLFNYLKNKNGNDFFPIYSRIGWDTIVEYNGTTLVKDDSHGGEVTVPAGMTVYFETPSKVFGHVACSLGDGTVISQNSVIPAIGLKNLDPHWAAEVHKMTEAITHIISIRYLMTLHFHPTNAYPKVKITNGAFWDAFPLNER
jgi:hypothetical protein